MTLRKLRHVHFDARYDHRVGRTPKTMKTYSTNVRLFLSSFAVALLYCIFGNLINSLIPLYGRTECQNKRISDLHRQRDPCGLSCRGWWPWDISGDIMFWIAFLLVLYTCIIISITVISITLAIVESLMHITAQLKYCRNCIEHLNFKNNLYDDGLKHSLNHIVCYHDLITR